MPLEVIDNFVYKFNPKDYPFFAKMWSENCKVFTHIGSRDWYRLLFKEMGATLGMSMFNEATATRKLRQDVYYLITKYNSLIKPRVKIWYGNCFYNEGECALENEDAVFLSKHFTKEETQVSIVFIATIGSEIDEECKRLHKNDETYNASLLNGIGAGACECLAEDLTLFFRDKLKNPALTRLTAGVKGWDVIEQKKIFRLLKPEDDLKVSMDSELSITPNKTCLGLLFQKDKMSKKKKYSFL